MLNSNFYRLKGRVSSIKRNIVFINIVFGVDHSERLLTVIRNVSTDIAAKTIATDEILAPSHTH